MNGKVLHNYEGGKTVAQLPVDLSLPELLGKLGPVGTKTAYQTSAEKCLLVARSIWAPKLTYRWFRCVRRGKSGLDLICPTGGEKSSVDLGYSIRFVEGAEQVLIGVYTVGYELEELAKSASKKGLYLDSYIYDMISLGVLDKVNDRVNELIERYGGERGWGVSPFLSPGSVHGWDLKGQLNIINLLPISDIGVESSPAGILQPFKSLSFLLAAGPGLRETKVGTTCQACSCRDNCEMRGQYYTI